MKPIKRKLKKDFVSIGFMTYNNASYIERSLENLIFQDYPLKDIFIFDDYSTDGTFEICQALSEKFPFVHLQRNSHNMGFVENFNKTLNAIDGEFFLWACPDDIYEKTFLSSCVEAFKKTPKAILATCAVKVFIDSTLLDTYRYSDFSLTASFRERARNIINGRSSKGKKLLYHSIIHTLTRTSYLDKIYNEKIIISCEVLWIVNALIWGEIAYVNQILLTRYGSSVPYRIRNPIVHHTLTRRFALSRGTFAYLFLFLRRKDIPINKKKLYLLSFFYYMTLHVFPLWRYRVFQRLRRFLVFCDQALTKGRGRVIVRYIRYGKKFHNDSIDHR